jgi:pimeloyl-ACP methyl ester carboxylesterase
MRRGYVDTKAGQVHYRHAGEGDEVLVLLHHTASSSRTFTDLMKRLSTDLRVIALDTPGFGGSDPFSHQPTTGDLVDALSAAVEGLDIASYRLFGHHTGGAVATEWAVKFPERVRSLALFGGLGMGAETRAAWLGKVPEYRLHRDGSHLQVAWDRVNHGLTDLTESLDVVEILHREVIDVLTAGPRWPEAYRAVFSQDYETFLQKVTCPTLLLSAREDILGEFAEATARVNPAMTSIVLDGGNYLLEERADEVARIVRDFHAAAS